MTAICGIVSKFAAKLFKQYEMKRIVRMLSLLMVAATALSSCLGNDDETVATYSDMAITSFTLGTMNRYQHQTSTKTGNDTIVKTTFTGSLYPMTIDHLNRAIYNQTALPVGTDVSHVLCTVGTKNNGVVYLKRPTSDSLFYHQSSDSVDLSVPRTFRVFAIDGSGSRDYTVTLNVSSSAGLNFGWVKTDSIGMVADFDALRLVTFGDSIRLVDRDVVVKEDRAYRLKDGAVEVSADLEQWTIVTTAAGQLSRLIGASATELFALGTDGRMKRSVDDGATWQDEQTDEDSALLPHENTATVCWSYAPADDTDYVFLVGNDPASDEGMSLWRKISPRTGAGLWVCMAPDDTNRNRLPRLQQLSLGYYDGTILAMGAQDKVIYQSRDQGITWHRPSAFALPAVMTGTAALLTTDAADGLWVVADSGQIWKGTKL